MKRLLLMLLPMAAMASDDVSQWVERDSTVAIANRIDRDFSLTLDEGIREIKSLYPTLGDNNIKSYIDSGYVELRDGQGGMRMYRKSPKNLRLICRSMRQADGWNGRGSKARESRLAVADTIVSLSDKGDGTPVYRHRVTLRFSLEVPYNEALKGDTIRTWMPFPMTTDRQSDVRMLDTSHRDYILSSPDNSVHRTVYMEQPVMTGRDARFSYTFSYDVAGQYFSPEYIIANLKPYNKDSKQYKEYTATDERHIIAIPLAREIVGGETNPFRQSELVYDYIAGNIPWAGAREYSTLDCIPRYVLEHGYGDCGQVALLYISMMRTLGVPARWESGWMLHPGEKNYHDWAEVYFEGIGWVPVDVSFGRYTASGNTDVRTFCSHGQDIYRFASNSGVGGELYPPKRYVRSETVDFQAGEVETSRGNLFYPLWNSHLEIIKIEPLEK